MSRFFAVCFGAAAFFLISILCIIKGAGLFFAFKRAAIGLILFWLFGYFFGAVFTKIVEDRAVSKER